MVCERAAHAVSGGVQSRLLHARLLDYSPSNSVSRKSVTNMYPGLCVSRSDGFASIATACGVTPHAQKTGISPGRISTGSPKSGWRSLMPMAAGSPKWIGVPCARGNRAQMRVAGNGLRRRQWPHRHDHRTMKNAGRLARDVRADTSAHCSSVRRGAPVRRLAAGRFSKVNEQPMQKPTRSGATSDASRLAPRQVRRAIDAIARQIGAQIGARRHRAWLRRARLPSRPAGGMASDCAGRTAESRTPVARHDDQIGLHVAQCESRRRFPASSPVRASRRASAPVMFR